LEKEKGHLDQIESVRKELENQREKEKALQKKIEDLENNPVVLP
jgi:cell division protein FtsB